MTNPEPALNSVSKIAEKLAQLKDQKAWLHELNAGLYKLRGRVMGQEIPNNIDLKHPEPITSGEAPYTIQLSKLTDDFALELNNYNSILQELEAVL